MSHMKRTQIYHARDHNEENPLGSVAVTKHLEVAREEDVGSTSPLFKLTGNYT